jgi:Domain of unknown function (DUF4118)
MTSRQDRSWVERMTPAFVLPSWRAYLGKLHWMSPVRPAGASIALTLITILGYKFHLNATAVVSLYLLIVVLQSLVGGVMTSAVLTAAAGACLLYFFPPTFSSRIDDPLNQVALFIFLVVAHLITRLVSNARKTFGDNKTQVWPAQTAANFGNRDREGPSTAITNQMVIRRDAGIQKNGMRGSPVPDDLVYEQVSRIIASRPFKKSVRLKRLLEYIVDTTIKGETTSLKEWVIGTDVYGRGRDFDPRLDPIVRTEIRRLRRKLREYFETEGAGDAVVIEVPTGSYIPCFRDRCVDDVPKLADQLSATILFDRVDERLTQ